MSEDFDVVVDTRELGTAGKLKKTRLHEFLEDLRRRGLRVVVEKLDAGDIYVPGVSGREPGVVWEVKTVTDLLNAVRHGRFWDQVARLVGTVNAEPRLAIIGYLGVIDKLRDVVGLRWAPAAVMGVIESVEAQGVVVEFYPSFQDLYDHVVDVATRLSRLRRRYKLHAEPLEAGEPRITSLKDYVLYVVHGLTGPKTAEALLERFGSICGIVKAGPDELAEVRVGRRRLGHKRAKQIWETLHARYNQ